MPHTLFISDLHLSAHTPQTNAVFLQFLKTTASNAAAVYILGDFFECWVGDDDHDAFIDAIKAALNTLTQRGVACYFMPGNRDFLVRRRFARETGLQLLTEPYVLTLYDMPPMLLMHGDALCTDDHAHQRARRWMHNAWCQTMALQLPLRWRRAMGERLRQNSLARKNQLDPRIMDVTPNAVTDVMMAYRCQRLIHGHTHRPARHDVRLPNGTTGERIVLGDWHPDGIYLRIDNTGAITLNNTSHS